MGTVIDRRIRDGKEVFRLFSTVSDSYLTDELSKDELYLALMSFGVEREISAVATTFWIRIARTLANNTTDLCYRRVSDTAPWRKEENPSDEVDDLSEMMFMVLHAPKILDYSNNWVRGNNLGAWLMAAQVDEERLVAILRWAELAPPGAVWERSNLIVIRTEAYAR